MQNENLTDAINDPLRPLSISPEQWSMRRGSLKTDDNVIVAKAGGDMNGLEQVDMGVDSIIKGVEQINAGLKMLTALDMTPAEKAVLAKVKDLVDTAIAPYTADMMEILDSLEGKE